MSAIVNIPQFNLPAELMQQFAAFNGADDLDAGVSSGFPVMSIRGAKWRMVVGGEEHPIFMPGTKDLAPWVKVVILRANANVSKTFYAEAFAEGTDAKPDCYSNDGIAPAADSANPQSATCAQCPKNVWGSKVSPSGSKIKACADVRRIAILPAEDMNYSPVLLRVPAASLADLAAYGKALKQRGIPYAAVVTKLSFDPDAAYPKIMFQFDRVLTGEEMGLVGQRIGEPVVEDILGTTSRGSAPALAAPAQDKFGIPADAAPPVQAQAAEPVQAQAEPEPQAQPEPAEKPKRTRKATPEPEVQAQPEAAADSSGGMLNDIEAALAGLNL